MALSMRSLPTAGFSAHSPFLPTFAFVMKEEMQFRQPMQRLMSSGRPSSHFCTQWGSQMKVRAEPTTSCQPSAIWRSACSGERMKLAAQTGMETTDLISFAR